MTGWFRFACLQSTGNKRTRGSSLRVAYMMNEEVLAGSGKK